MATTKTALIAVELDRAELLRALGRAKKIARGASQIEAASWVRIARQGGDLFLEATDFANAVRVFLEGDAFGKFDAVLPLADLETTVKSLTKAGDDVQLIQAKRKDSPVLEVRALGKKRASTIKLPPRGEWPTLDFTPGECIYHGIGATLAVAVDGAIRFASNDITRPHLVSVAFDTVDPSPVVVSTDSYKLFVGDCPAAPKSERVKGGFKPGLDNLMVEPKPLSAAVKGLGDEEGVAMHDAGTHVLVLVSGAIYRLRKVDGKFPAWRSLMPSKDEARFHLVVDHDELSEACKAVAAAKGDVNRTMAMAVWLDRVTLSGFGDAAAVSVELPVVSLTVDELDYADLLKAAEPLIDKRWKTEQGAKTGAIKAEAKGLKADVKVTGYKTVKKPVKGSKPKRTYDESVPNEWGLQLDVPFRIGFNAEYLKDLAWALDGEADNTLRIDLITPLRPAVLSAGPDVALLMPIRLSDVIA